MQWTEKECSGEIPRAKGEEQGLKPEDIKWFITQTLLSFVDQFPILPSVSHSGCQTSFRFIPVHHLQESPSRKKELAIIHE